MFELGEKVECIDDNFYRDEKRMDIIISSFSQLPKKGEEYTVRGFRPTKHGVGILLEEIVNDPIQFADIMAEPGFALKRFRKKTEVKDKVEEYAEEKN